jgi:hypothetical protein
MTDQATDGMPRPGDEAQGVPDPTAAAMPKPAMPNPPSGGAMPRPAMAAAPSSAAAPPVPDMILSAEAESMPTPGTPTPPPSDDTMPTPAKPRVITAMPIPQPQGGDFQGGTSEKAR